MKRIILVGLMVLSVSAFSLDHGLISGFEVGWNISQQVIIENKDTWIVNNYEDTLFIKLTTGYRIQGLRLIGEYTNTLEQTRVDNYTPLQDTFYIGLSYTLHNFKIEVSNKCSHSVVAQNDKREVYINSGQRLISLSYYKEF